VPAPEGDPLRVLFVCGSDFASPSEKQALWFANELIARGHAVMASLGGDPATAAREGLDERATVRGHGFGLRRLRAADIEAARAFAPSVIHAFNPRLGVVAAAAGYARATGAPFVVHWEDDEWGLARAAFGGSPRLIGTRALRRAAAVVRPSAWPFATRASLRSAIRGAAAFDALTPAIAAEVERRSGRPATVVLPANPPASSGADDGAAALPEELRGRELVVYTGALFPEFEGDIRLGMRAVAEVRARRPAVAFVHTGRVLPRYSPERIAAEEGLGGDGALFLGYVPFATVRALLRAASVLIQPGAPTEVNRYRLPSKMQSYLASGTPTISFAPGFAELLEDRAEVLKTHTAEPGELAARVLELLEDPELARRVGEGGRRAAARLFDPAANTDALVAFYRAAISGAR
jgi:glycosyltransferase involved in cell wall biosynthesis